MTSNRRGESSRGRKIGLGLVVAAAVVAATVSITAAGGSLDTAGGSPPKQAVEAFAVLRIADPVSDARVLAYAKSIADDYNRAHPELGPLDATGLRLARDEEDLTVSVLPGSDTICLIEASRSAILGFSCTSVALAVTGKQPMLSTAKIGSDTVVIMLLPDGVESVTADLTGGGTAVGKVVSNVAYLKTAGRIDAVSWIAPDGSAQSTELPEEVQGQ